MAVSSKICTLLHWTRSLVSIWQFLFIHSAPISVVWSLSMFSIKLFILTSPHFKAVFFALYCIFIHYNLLGTRSRIGIWILLNKCAPVILCGNSLTKCRQLLLSGSNQNFQPLLFLVKFFLTSRKSFSEWIPHILSRYKIRRPFAYSSMRFP